MVITISGIFNPNIWSTDDIVYTISWKQFSFFSVYDDGYESGKCCDDSDYADTDDVLYPCAGIRMLCDL